MRGMGFMLPLMALALCMVWVGYSVVYKNLESKDVVFSYSALVAAAAMLALNIFFSLQQEEKNGTIDIHIYKNEKHLDIYSLLNKPNYLVFNREEITKILFPNKAIESLTQKDVNSEILTNYLKIAFMGSYLDDFPDWDKKVIGEFIGNMQISSRFKKDQARKNEVFYSRKDIVELLGINGLKEEAIGFISFNEGLILPPNTRISSNNDSITMETDFLKVTAKFSISSNYHNCGFNYLPEKNVIFNWGEDGPLSVFGKIDFQVIMKKQRAGSPHMKKHLAWSNEIYQMLSNGFSPTKAHINKLS